MINRHPAPPADDSDDYLFGSVLPDEPAVDPGTRALPLPGSRELLDLPRMNSALAVIYSLLYEHRGDEYPPTENDIASRIVKELGKAQSQAGRRKRDLYPFFEIEKVKIPGSKSPGYRLVGWKPKPRITDGGISGPVRAEVLRPGRCYMCGKSPAQDGVKLVVDHKIPQAWGGSDDIDNLQPLCEQCNGEKKDNFSSYSDSSERIRRAISQDEPHRRIAELLIAFDGNWVPGNLIEIVASAKQFQEDWQKRTRDLRYLGWEIEFLRQPRPGSRTQVSYRASHWEELPEGSIGKIVRRIEKERNLAKRARQATSPDDGTAADGQ